MEHPLDGAVEQDGVIEIGNLAVEPEVDAGDGRVFKVRELFANGRALGGFGKNAIESVERKGQDQEIKIPTRPCKLRRDKGGAPSCHSIILPIFSLVPELQLNPRCIGGEAFDWLTEMQSHRRGRGCSLRLRCRDR